MNFKWNTTLLIRRRRCTLQSSSRQSPRNSNLGSADFGLMSATKRQSCFPSLVYKLALIQDGQATMHPVCRLRFIKRESRVIYFDSMLETTVRFRSPGKSQQFFPFRLLSPRTGIHLHPIYIILRVISVRFVFLERILVRNSGSCTFRAESIDKKKSIQ